MKILNSIPSFIINPINSLIKNPIPTIINNSVTSLISKRINVPGDLSSLTTYNPDDEVDPYEVDIAKEGVDEIWGFVEDLYRSGISPGVVFCLRRHGKIVLNRAIGHSHGNGPDDSHCNNNKILISPDTPICQFSASKAITAMLIHLLAEKNEINLLDPVSYYIPEFAKHGKENTTIHHFLSHHAGIPSPPPGTKPELLFDYEQCVQKLCDSKPKSQAGRRQAYHAITGGMILGEIIHRVTGMTIREFLRETIQKPLGFRYFTFGVDKKDLSKVAINYTTGLPLFFPLSAIAKNALNASWEEVVNISNDPRYMEAIIPAGNLVATANEMSQFFQLLLNGGELNGVRIFNPLTIRRAVIEADKLQIDRSLVIPMRYSAGFMLGESPVGLWGSFSKSAYGHIGFINILCWADPDRDIAVSLQTTGKSLIGGHLLIISQLMAAISRHCTPKIIPDEFKKTNESYILPIQKIIKESLLTD